MLSPARAAANAANAQLSTGPKTAEGKATVSQNARKHGLTARDLVVPDDQREEFEQFLAGHTDELQPVGSVEHTIFNQLVRAAWDLRRIGRMQADLCRNGVDPLKAEGKRAEIERFARYEASAERSYYRALRELRTAQTNRTLRRTLDPRLQGMIPEMAVITQVTKQTQTNDELDRRGRYRMLTQALAAPLFGKYPSVQNKPTGPYPPEVVTR